MPCVFCFLCLTILLACVIISECVQRHFCYVQKRKSSLFTAKIRSIILKLKIIGNGKDKIYLENYSKKLKLRNVEFTGARNPEEDYKRASIFCMTSTCEGFGMVLTEALQYNVIPIAYKSFESIDDIIINEINGFLVKPFSTKLYVKTLGKLISDKKYRESVHINIKKDNIVEKFSVERIANQWEELFNKLTSLTTS